MKDNLHFTEIVLTKLCHDLASPIGAVWNGLEFLEMDEDSPEGGDSRVQALVSASAIEAMYKLRFFRYIYGLNDSEGEVDSEALKTHLTDFFSGSKIEPTMHNGNTATDYIQLTANASRLTLSLAYLASQSLITGGTLDVHLERTNTNKQVRIIVKSDTRFKKLDYLTTFFKSYKEVEPTVDNIMAHWAAMLAERLKSSIEVSIAENSMTISCRL